MTVDRHCYISCCCPTYCVPHCCEIPDSCCEIPDSCCEISSNCCEIPSSPCDKKHCNDGKQDMYTIYLLQKPIKEKIHPNCFLTLYPVQHTDCNMNLNYNNYTGSLKFINDLDSSTNNSTYIVYNGNQHLTQLPVKIRVIYKPDCDKGSVTDKYVFLDLNCTSNTEVNIWENCHLSINLELLDYSMDENNHYTSIYTISFTGDENDISTTHDLENTNLFDCSKFHVDNDKNENETEKDDSKFEENTKVEQNIK